MKRLRNIALCILTSIVGLSTSTLDQVEGGNFDEIAKSLSNPGAPNATLNYKLSTALSTVICPGQTIRIALR